MGRIYRSLLGLSVVTLLVPAAFVTFPGLLDGDQPQTGEGSALQGHEQHQAHATAPSTTTTLAAEYLALDTLPELDAEDNKPALPPPGETAAEADDHAHHASSTTTNQPNTSQSGSGGGGGPGEGSSTAPTGGVITGSMCPCTVTGTATLEGKISLQGDLVVDGGTLVARSGVDLEGNGNQIMFMNGGKADFQGTPTSTWSGNGSNQNLKRDINFNNLGRIMFHMGAGPSTLKYFTVSNSGTSAIGDYPLHWHLNGNSTRGTIVEGVVVVNGKHHAFVPHGSHGITFRETIAKTTKGDAYWWDPPGTNESCSLKRHCTLDNSNNITYDRALADGVTNAPGDNRGWRLAGFNLGAGSGNVIRNSLAINVAASHVKDCSGFHWPGKANHNDGGNVWFFSSNRAINPSGCHGIFVWQNDGNKHVVEGFSGSGIDHGAYTNLYEYRNVQVPYMNVHAAGVSVIGGRIDTVFAKRHRNDRTPTAEFRDVSIGRFVIQNGKGEVPGTYVLVNTGLTCEDIQVESIVSGTKVTVDGEECEI